MPTECTAAGDSLRAHKVIVTARRVGKRTEVVHGSGRHQRQQVVFTDSVYAVIALPLKAIGKAQDKRNRT